MNESEKIRLIRNGEPDVVFEGRLIADVIGERTGAEAGRFALPASRLRLFVAIDGRYVAVIEDLRRLDRVERRIEICANEAAVIEFFRHTDLAKALYHQAGIGAEETLGRAANDIFDRIFDFPEDSASNQKPRLEASSSPEALSSGQCDQPQVSIIDEAAFKRRLETAERSGYEHQAAVLKTLGESGFVRRLVQVESDIPSRIADLESRFPNFREVISYVRRQLHLCRLAKQSVSRVAPILLAGPPGIGKTRVFTELAELLGAEFHVVACNTTTASFVLSGGDSLWREAKPGRIAHALINGKTANPIVLLDEIDKIAADSRYDPFGPLYSLLEPQTARKFIDEYLMLELDASNVLWVATANDAQRLPEPILSRFKTFTIPVPTQAQTAAIARSVYRDLIEDQPWGNALAPQLPESLVWRLGSLSPRIIRQLLLDACGYAAVRISEVGATRPLLELTVTDMDAALAQIDHKSRQPVGFVWPSPAERTGCR